jgi:hypothetical protein
MTRKFLLSGVDLLGYCLDNSRTLAWYLTRRLQRD